MVKVFREVEAASSFLFIFEGAVPVSRELRLSVVREMETRQACIGSDRGTAFGDLDVAVQISVLVGERVVVAESDEGPHFEARPGGSVFHSVFDDRGAFAV